MKKRYLTAVLVLGIIGLAATAGCWTGVTRPEAGGISGDGAQPTRVDPTRFARADTPRAFSFPEDHGAHPDYQTEWWYYTGNLVGEGGRRFGFQLTFFRRALLPAEDITERQSSWATRQVYMAHFALSDIGQERFYAFERLGRGAAGIAGAQAIDYRVWLEDWQAAEASSTPVAACQLPDAVPCAHRLQAAQGEVAIDLTLVDSAGPTLQGDAGLSRKGEAPGQASYYYSLTRMATSGEITVAGQRFRVSGWSWMDHEWSTSALSQDQVGWDWFSIQLDGGSRLMLFQIRRADGSIDPFSSGLWMGADGSTRPIQQRDFQITVEDTWKSPHSGATYPAQWTLAIPVLDITLGIRPLMADQELNVSYAYWEGAVRVVGSQSGLPLNGYGYVELTGYSGSMGGDF